MYLHLYSRVSHYRMYNLYYVISLCFIFIFLFSKLRMRIKRIAYCCGNATFYLALVFLFSNESPFIRSQILHLVF